MNNIRLYLLIVGLTLPLFSKACTSVGFAGDSVLGGGTILAKNRDASFMGYERLEVFHPKGGYRYIALVYGKDGKTYPYVAAGTNEAGLTVMNNDASSQLPPNENNIETQTTKYILTHYSTVAQVKKNAKTLFGKNKPALYLMSDATTVANFQAGYGHKYGEQVTTNGTVWDTNFFYLRAVAKDNVSIPHSTKMRTSVLKAWLKTKPEKIQLGDITRLFASHYHGPFNSIDREFSVAQFFVRREKGQRPYLYVKETIPTQKYNVYHINLTSAFFKKTPVGPLNDHKYGLLGSINMQRLKDKGF